MFKATADYVTEKEIAVVSSAVENELSKSGVSNSSDMAKTIVAMARMEDVDQSAKNAILNDSRSRKVYLELIGDTFNKADSSGSPMQRIAAGGTPT